MPYKDAEAQRAAQKKHYADNADTYKTRRTTGRAYRKDYLIALKNESGCQVCGYNRSHWALDFHHLNEAEKKYTPSKLHYAGFKNIDRELENCMVLCTNCHREHHAGVIDANAQARPISEYQVFSTWDKTKRFRKNSL